jgi:FANCL C-terminal domain
VCCRSARQIHPGTGCHAIRAIAILVVVGIRSLQAVHYPVLQGVEECLICYSIVHPANGQLPKMPCRTCAKCFHAACLYKWFQSSAKSTCPHCQSPWLHGAR